MTDRLKKSRQMTFWDMIEPISLPGSAGGTLHSILQDGATVKGKLHGREAARVSLSPTQAKRLGLPTNGISGQPGTVLLNDADRLSYLESRLRQRLGKAGSTLFSMTWKTKRTPAGREFSQLVASAPRTSDSACGSLRTGWASPAAQEAGGTPERFLERKQEARDKGSELGVSLTSLSLQAQATGWATPAHRDYRFANAKSWKDSGGGKKGEQLNNQVVHLTPGATSNGSPAQMEKRGQLNPDLSRWLQGYPIEHLNCAPMATLSSLRRQRRS
jgi:hypothetical protein